MVEKNNKCVRNVNFKKYSKNNGLFQMKKQLYSVCIMNKKQNNSNDNGLDCSFEILTIQKSNDCNLMISRKSKNQFFFLTIKICNK